MGRAEEFDQKYAELVDERKLACSDSGATAPFPPLSPLDTQKPHNGRYCAQARDFRGHKYIRARCLCSEAIAGTCMTKQILKITVQRVRYMLDTSPLIHAQNCAKNAPFQFSKFITQLFNIPAY